MEYLGHYIPDKGVATDPRKVEEIANWPLPKNLKQLREFLGLAGYYSKFVRWGPLSLLLKKSNFEWNEEATTASETLKTALCKALILALPKFEKKLVVETHARGCGIGVAKHLLEQRLYKGYPLAYISKHLKGIQLHLSIYEKELLVVVFAALLIDQSFYYQKIEQRSLEYLLEQRLNTQALQQWLPKLLEFDYDIHYKQGKENLVTDTLSRVESTEIPSMALTMVDSDLWQTIHYQGCCVHE
ncbi:hypothetical protein V2J09_011041 [Rumex salicifolius]